MNEQDTNLNSLFSHGLINEMELKNRIVMPAIATNFAGEDGEVTDCLFNYYVERAQGGAGLIIIENTNVDYPIGKAGAFQLRIDDDKYILGLKRLVEAIHSKGGKIALQLNHAGGLANLDAKHQDERVAPSIFNYPLGISCQLSINEIEGIAEKFASAALRAKKAQFDAIEIHGAHGYLISQFTSPVTNHRSDEYGGTLENRMSFAKLVIRKIREVVGKSFPVIFRFSADEFIEGGNRADVSPRIAQALEQSAVDALDVSGGLTLTPESTDWVVESASFPEGSKVYLAELVRRSVKIPIITVGVIRTPKFANAIIKEEKADFVAIGRGLLADPYWPQKAIEGKESEINKCTSCRACFVRRSRENLPILCSINPKVGKEKACNYS